MSTEKNDKKPPTTDKWKYYQNLARSLLIQQPPSGENDKNTTSYLTEPSANDPMKWNGWGYQDTAIYVNKNNQVEISGKRYEQTFPSSVRVLPKLRAWAEAELSLNLDRQSFPNTSFPNLPKAIVNQVLEEQLTQYAFKFSTLDIERIHHSHGQTCKELFHLRHSQEIQGRIPDLIIWPQNQAQVEQLVQTLAREFNLCIIPFGGGTSVTSALECPETETRLIVSLDMRDMDQILTIDSTNMLMTVQAGIRGLRLHEQLALENLTLGHEPDSWEFSTVGGWVATRASGMKKNTYGNIEDMLVNVTLVSPVGTSVRHCHASRTSMGPDFHHLVLGSEGVLGVITSVTLRLRHKPTRQIFDSYVFPTYGQGIAAFTELATTARWAVPSSLRLMDNTQFLLGQALKPVPTGPRWVSAVADVCKKTYLTKIRQFDPKTLCAATLVLEGNYDQDPALLTAQESKIGQIMTKHGAIRGGSENGLRGYFLTYVIAYLRDFALNYYFLSESFETFIPWNHIQKFCVTVKQQIEVSAKAYGVQYRPLVCSRVTQVYDNGACVYVYFGMNYYGLQPPAPASSSSSEDDTPKVKQDQHYPLYVFEQIEKAAIQVILQCGGSLSHHHGIGKHRKAWYPSMVSKPVISTLQSIKQTLDPANVFAAGNLFDSESPEPAPLKSKL